jgi:hypothetical protein
MPSTLGVKEGVRDRDIVAEGDRDGVNDEDVEGEITAVEKEEGDPEVVGVGQGAGLLVELQQYPAGQVAESA